MNHYSNDPYYNEFIQVLESSRLAQCALGLAIFIFVIAIIAVICKSKEEAVSTSACSSDAISQSNNIEPVSFNDSSATSQEKRDVTSLGIALFNEIEAVRTDGNWTWTKSIPGPLTSDEVSSIASLAGCWAREIGADKGEYVHFFTNQNHPKHGGYPNG